MSINLETTELCRYTTSQGSNYIQYTNLTTKRFKTPHLFHDATDVGWKERSELTVYVPSAEARKIAKHIFSDGKKWVVFQDRKILLVAQKPNENVLELVHEPIPYLRIPRIGLSPFEVWGFNAHDIGHFVTGKMHVGNEIVEVIGF